ncbi:MAG TPA: RNA polymerase sigma factor [Actinophytocola sp.]|uniref:RNA polymerase sigma factor n=1 Tax=Actinophytocola sp. TaxID=1872138 RepID=UPI002DB967E8|nr:RNA polymerase sigma factor [Actinophytocola sp.]HEU5469134.1 RNA polymerase sigma factor [Actinophytocola sp.]
MASVNAGDGTGSPDHPDLSGPDGADALARLYDAHARDLYRYLARRLDPSTADDLVAQTFLVAWERRRRYRPDRASARAWLYGIATNLLRHHARAELRGLRAIARDNGRAQRRPAGHRGRGPGRRRSAGPQAVRRAGPAAGGGTRRTAAGRLGRAGPDRGAEALGVRVGTVRTRLHRARTALRGCLTSEEGNHD